MPPSILKPDKLIWIIDASIADASHVKSLLKKDKIKFELFFSLKDVTNKLATFKSYDTAPSAIIGDIEIPDGNFFGFIESIISNKPDWQDRIMVCTHTSHGRFMEECERRGETYLYLSKNRVDKDLVKMVTELLKEEETAKEQIPLNPLKRRRANRLEGHFKKLKDLYYASSASLDHAQMKQIISEMQPLLDGLEWKTMSAWAREITTKKMDGLKFKREVREFLNNCEQELEKVSGH